MTDNERTSIMYASTRIARFGRGAVILRDRQGQGLEEGELRSAAPTLFATGKHSSRSDRYSHIPTFEVIQGLAREGFQPVEVRVGGSGDEDKRAHTKHLIRFRSRNETVRVNGSIWELLLLNSHDGTSAYKLMSGFFRIVCSNGLVTADDLCEVRIPHKGDVVHNVIEGTYTVLNEGPRIADNVQRMQGLTLSTPEQEAYGEAAALLRWHPTEANPDIRPPVRAEHVVSARRFQDAQDNSLWGTFNRAQENLVNGGQTYLAERAGRPSYRRTRAVNGIDGNVSLNRALWTLTQRMLELKAA